MTRFLSLFLTLLLLSATTYAGDFPPPPSPPRLVNDYEGFFPATFVHNLEDQLVAFDRETSTQVTLVVKNDIGEYDINQYAAMLADEWGIGRKDKDNGIIMLICPAKREVSIQVGYGLEGVIPDAIAKRIIEKEIIPEFAQGNYEKGVTNAMQSLMALAKGEFSAAEYMEEPVDKTGIIATLLMFALFIALFIIGNARKARQYSIGHNIPFWVAMMMMGGSKGRQGGGFGSFSSGRGSFGGFGGGGFGGGGASGRW